jgi:cytochrome c oxidase subunit 2
MTIDSFMTAASDYANEVDGTFWVVVVISSLITLLVAALIAGFSLRYRRGSTARRGPLSERFGRDVEIGWTVATLFLFLFIFWWAASNQLSALNVPDRAMEIHVVAKQWMWRVQQPGGAREINEIHVPENVPIRLAMTSEDVIHDLFLPTMRLKQDVLPGRYTYLSFTPTKTGVFHLTCAEYCGTDHSVMAGRLVVMTAPDYARWTNAQPEADDLAHQGEALFGALGCSGCHAPTSSIHAPDLHGLYGRAVPLADGRVVTADEAYLRDSILLPAKDIVAGYAPIMPSFRSAVTEDDLVKLIAYLKSLSTSPTGAAPCRGDPCGRPVAGEPGAQTGRPQGSPLQGEGAPQ